jgi:undecaprenyl-diphosphatase
MNLVQAVSYGLVQGIAEFLPVSSSGHLVVLPWLLDWEDPGLAFDVALHFGTLLAVLAYFHKDLLRLAGAFVRSVAERKIGGDVDRRMAWLVLLASIPGGAVGYLAEHAAEGWFRQPWKVAVAMIALGVVLWAVDALASRARSFDKINLRDALLIGLAQACAVVPGVSRSGATITAARALGLDREASARFSFLLYVPIVLGASLKKGVEMLHGGRLGSAELLAIAISAASGFVAIGLLLRLVRTRSYLPFAIYRLLFGGAVLALWLARARGAG